MAHKIHVSVVSHGHATHIERLLADMSALPNADLLQLTLTLNIPERINYSLDALPFPAYIRHNTDVFSFSKNHNLAFNTAPPAYDARYFLILNPDTRLQGDVLQTLARTLNQLSAENVGVVGPQVVNQDGILQENGRIFPNFGYLLRKLMGKEPDNPIQEDDGIARVEWLAGMCLLLETETFERLGGFDEDYRLYYEDVDLCLRLKQLGLDAALVCSAEIVHIGQWKSRRNITHLIWHCGSALRFLVKLYRFRSGAT